MTKTTAYLLRNHDVSEAIRTMNRPASAGDLREALSELLAHAEKIEETDD